MGPAQINEAPREANAYLVRYDARIKVRDVLVDRDRAYSIRAVAELERRRWLQLDTEIVR